MTDDVKGEAPLVIQPQSVTRHKLVKPEVYDGLVKALRECVEVLQSDAMANVWSYLYAHGFKWTGPQLDMRKIEAAIAAATEAKITSGDDQQGSAAIVPERYKAGRV